MDQHSAKRPDLAAVRQRLGTWKTRIGDLLGRSRDAWLEHETGVDCDLESLRQEHESVLAELERALADNARTGGPHEVREEFRVELQAARRQLQATWQDLEDRLRARYRGEEPPRR